MTRHIVLGATLLLGTVQGAAATLPRLAPAGATIELALPEAVSRAITEDGAPGRARVQLGDTSREFVLEVAKTEVPIVWEQSGAIPTTVTVWSGSGQELHHEEAVVRVVPGPITLLPPFLAILVALLVREVVAALFVGVLSGSLLLFGNPLAAVADSLERIVMALADPSRAKIVVFSLVLGGMIGVIQKNGGTRGIVELLASRVRSRRGAQLATWLMGIVIFFDDYANALLLGTTMRPLTDRYRVSREKLAFLVDSTSAPVASLALLSTWIGYELEQLRSATGLDDGAAYTLIIDSLAYRFYPILLLAFIVMLVVSGRDFGPMLRAEQRALRTGQLLRPGATPASDFDSKGLEPEPGQPTHALDALLPILSVIGTTCAGLYATGRQALAADGIAAPDLRTILGRADAYNSLLWAAFAGSLVAIALTLGRRNLRLPAVMEAWLGGIRSMLAAIVILLLAAAIGKLCTDLYVPELVVSVLGQAMPLPLLPAAVFLTACVTSFATGTSWGTIALLTPLVPPLSGAVARSAGLDAAGQYDALVMAVASILAGSIFGDHCSPISDTTVLSSLAASCDHVDHVHTQAPIALVIAAVSVIVGDGLVAIGLPILLVWCVALATLAAITRLVARPIEEG